MLSNYGREKEGRGKEEKMRGVGREGMKGGRNEEMREEKGRESRKVQGVRQRNLKGVPGAEANVRGTHGVRLALGWEFYFKSLDEPDRL